jgi:nucleoid-associated protein YejK
MGIGALGTTSLVFVRKFRFILSSEHLSSDWIRNLTIDWRAKNLLIEAYEVFTEDIVPIRKWAKEMEEGKYENESFTFVTLDGLGNELYKYRFEGLRIFGKFNHFDYAASDKSVLELHVSFRSYTELPPEQGKYPVDNARPLEVNHLNEKIVINQ